MKNIKIITISLCVLVIFSGCLDRKAKQPENITRGLDFMVKGDYNKAIELFTAMLLEDQKNTLALNYRSLAYYKKGDSAAGLNDLEKLYDIDKDYNFTSQNILDLMFNCFNVRRNFPKTIEMGFFYINKFPDDVSVNLVYNTIAQSYLRLKEFDKAITSFQKVVENTEKDDSLLGKNLNADAKGAIGFIKNNSGDDRKPLIMFSDIQTEMDPLKKLEIAKKMLVLYPNSSLADEVQYQIARLYSVDGLNDFDQALIEYQIFLKKYPDSILAKQVKNSIMGITEKYDPVAGKLKGSVH